MIGLASSEICSQQALTRLIIGLDWRGRLQNAVCPADAITMQLRVAGCIIIVALVRVLNIAVPVLYRNAINKLAEVSDLTHPSRGEKPETFTFLDVRCYSIIQCPAPG